MNIIKWKKLLKTKQEKLFDWEIFITWIDIGISIIVFWIWVIFIVIKIIYWFK